MTKVIAILVMAEEKWQEADFLCKEIEDRGYKALILDMAWWGNLKELVILRVKRSYRLAGEPQKRSSV